MTRVRCTVLLVSAVVAAMPLLARADEGPVVIANREPHPYLTLDPFQGSIGVTGTYLAQSTTNNGSSTRATDTLLTHDLTLSTGGSIISRNLASWSATGTLSLAQEWSNDGTDKEQTFEIFDTYNVQFNAFGATTFPISAYAERSQDYVNRAFAALLRDTTTAYGGTAHYNNSILPSTLSLSHTNTTQSTLGGQEQFSIDQDEVEYSTSFQPFERQVISLNYHYATTSQNNPGLGTSNSDLQGLSVAHNWSIDPAGRYTLTTSFDYSQQTGNFPFTQVRFGEQLRMRHTDTLESVLNYAYEQHDYSTTSTTQNTVTASATHRLYDSLVTNARIGASRTEDSFTSLDQSNNASSNNYFATLGFNYQKKMYMGRFGANLSAGYNQTDNSAIGAPQQVIGDTESFIDPMPIVLRRQGVNASTVAVFNGSGTRQFVPALDYTVHSVGQTVQIQRVIGGAINAGDSVQLNYQVDPLPGYTSTSTSLAGGVNYLFDDGLLKGVYVFAQYYQVNQTI